MVKQPIIERQSSFVGHMIQLGHQLDLFRVVEAYSPLTSQELAKQTDCNLERIQEWLTIMVQYGLIEYDKGTNRFSTVDDLSRFVQIGEAVYRVCDGSSNDQPALDPYHDSGRNRLARFKVGGKRQVA